MDMVIFKISLLKFNMNNYLNLTKPGVLKHEIFVQNFTGINSNSPTNVY